MRSPSVKRLLDAFPADLTPEGANLIRQLCRLADQLDELEELIADHPLLVETHAYVRRLHNSPYRSAMWRRTVILHAVNRLIGGFGVGAIDTGKDGFLTPPEYEYVNMGDPYTETLIYSRANGADNLFTGCWGDTAERHL